MDVGNKSSSSLRAVWFILCLLLLLLLLDVLFMVEVQVVLTWKEEEAVNQKNTEQISTVKNSTVTVAALGDILLLRSLAVECYETNFEHLWADIKHVWDNPAVDFAFANLEGTSGNVNKKGELENGAKGFDMFNKNVYDNGVSSGGFNYHPTLVSAVKKAGISVLTTANNHAFDRGFAGITSTIEEIEKVGILQVGTSADEKAESDLSWFKFSEKDGEQVAWIGCTNILCSTCRKSLRSSEEKVRKRILFCNKVPALITRLLEKSRVKFVFVAAHWGAQFKQEPSKSVQNLAIEMLESGATVVFGNHPHLLQKSFFHITKDKRRTFCMFSLGSLVSGLGSGVGNRKVALRSSKIMLITVEEGSVVSVKERKICEIKAFDVNFGRSLRKMVLVESFSECEKQ